MCIHIIASEVPAAHIADFSTCYVAQSQGIVVQTGFYNQLYLRMGKL